MILALLANGPVHGYDLLRQLDNFKMFADVPPDTSGVYKTLKVMTTEGLIIGDWDVANTGPARRPFTITDKGRKCLMRWATTLETYQQQVVEIAEIVAHSILPHEREKQKTKSKKCSAVRSACNCKNKQ